MIAQQSLHLAVSGFPNDRFDIYMLEQPHARWRTIGPSPMPIVYVDSRGGLHPLVAVPTQANTSCVMVPDLAYLARTLLPMVVPSRPLRADEAIDLGDLLDLALRDGVGRHVREGKYAVLKSTHRGNVAADGTSATWRALWWPRIPPISPQIATACIACARGLTPEARRHIQESEDTIPWRRACAVAASDPARQLALLQSRVTIRAIRDAKRASEEG